MAECGCACADCQCGTERIESLRAALREAEAQRDRAISRGVTLWRDFESDQTWWQQNAIGWHDTCQEAWRQRDWSHHCQTTAEQERDAERGRAEAAEQEIEEHRQHAQDKHRRAEALEAALREFGKHKTDCAMKTKGKRIDTYPCDCGLSRALAGEPRQQLVRREELGGAMGVWEVAEPEREHVSHCHCAVPSTECWRHMHVPMLSDPECRGVEARALSESEREGAERQ